MVAINLQNPMEISRSACPISMGIPFPVGTLSAGDGLCLRDDKGITVPLQSRPLARWPDGSIKWALVDFHADIGPLQGKSYQLTLEPSVSTAHALRPLRITEEPDCIRVDNGVFELEISRRRFGLLRHLAVYGEQIIAPGSSSDLLVVASDGTEYRASRDSHFRLEIEESGPLRCVLRATGCHVSSRGDSCLDFVLRMIVCAGYPYLVIRHQFINREPPEEGITVSRIAAEQGFSFAEKARPSVLQYGPGYHRPAGIVDVDGRIEVRAEEKIVHALGLPSPDYDESQFPYHERRLRPPGQVAGWLALAGQGAGVVTTLRWFQENFPLGVSSDASSLVWDLWPEWAGPVELSQGIAKTHEICLAVRSRDNQRSWAELLNEWQFPIHATIPFAWYQSTKVSNLDLCLAYEPRKYPGIELHFHDLFQTLRKYYPYRFVWPWGKFDYGDDVNENYTRNYAFSRFGQPDLVWSNNEYDYIFAAFIQYCRMGHPELLNDLRICSRHLMDVDFIHYSMEPFRMHGVATHSARHTTGTMVPSHMWTEGLLGYYYLTGDPDALETAIAIGDHLIRWVDERWQTVIMNGREAGWPLIALCAVYEATYEERFLSAMRKIVDYFENANPGGSLMPQQDDYLLVAVGLMGVKRYHRLTGEDRARRLLLEKTDWWLRNCTSPEGVIDAWRYPNPKAAPTPLLRGGLLFEILGYAWDLTGDLTYLHPALLILDLFGMARALPELPARTSNPTAVQFRSWIDLLGSADRAGKLEMFARDAESVPSSRPRRRGTRSGQRRA